MRYGAICKALHVLPRSGGVLDQPYDEIVRLERIMEAFSNYEEYQNAKQKSRDRTKKRHAPTVTREILE